MTYDPAFWMRSFGLLAVETGFIVLIGVSVARFVSSHRFAARVWQITFLSIAFLLALQLSGFTGLIHPGKHSPQSLVITQIS